MPFWCAHPHKTAGTRHIARPGFHTSQLMKTLPYGNPPARPQPGPRVPAVTRNSLFTLQATPGRGVAAGRPMPAASPRPV